MKDSEKKAIFILIVISILIIAGIFMLRNNKNKQSTVSKVTNEKEEKNIEEYVQYLEDGTKLNVSTELTKAKMIDGLEITNIEVKEKNGISTLRADVENKKNNNK